MGALFNAVLYQPLLNLLVLISNVVPGGDIGIAIIIVTIIVRLIIYPISQKAVVTQAKMRTVQPEIDALREKYKDNKEKQALELMALYKKYGINPFSSTLLLLIQIPILIALYRVFAIGLPFHPEALYSFVHVPENLHFIFLGIVDITKASIVLALLAGISQYIQIWYSAPAIPAVKNADGSIKNDFARTMNMQMRYVMPVMITIFAFKLPAAIVIYWITNNIFMIAQELIVRRKKQEQVSTS